MLYFIHIASGIVLILLGATIYYRRKYHWIAGYQALNKSEREHFDMKKFALLVRNVFGISGLILILMSTVLVYLGQINLSLLLSFATVVGAILYVAHQIDKFKQQRAY
ncbi:MAG: DUF3784 domain-containing protein [Cyclobacteriaceae bacterium]